MGGSNAQDSTLERRSLVWNDNGIVNGTVPDDFYEAVTYKGKFFTRGCRGMIEQIQLYCIGDAVDEITLRYSPHPCLGPFGEVTIVPAAAWAWQDFVIEEMWDYDSLFIWVYEAEANVDWAYDAVQPLDGHLSGDAGATWADMAIRPFMRVVYTGETPGDVPVSGIINNIPIPNISSEMTTGTKTPALGVDTEIVGVDGAGYVDYIILHVYAANDSENMAFLIYCDGEMAFTCSGAILTVYGFTPNTPSSSLTQYAVDGVCVILLTKRFEFRRRFSVNALTFTGGIQVSVAVLPALMG